MDAITESLKEQFELYINNYHKFTLEVIPMLENNTSYETMTQLYKTAEHYHTAFKDFLKQDVAYSKEFMVISGELKATLGAILGINDKV